MAYETCRCTSEHRTSPLFRGGFSHRRGHAHVSNLSLNQSNYLPLSNMIPASQFPVKANKNHA